MQQLTSFFTVVLTILFLNIQSLNSQVLTCESVTFNIENTCNSGYGSIFISPSDSTILDITYVTTGDVFGASSTFSDSLYTDYYQIDFWGGADLKIECYVGDELCHTIEDFFYCDGYNEFQANCFDFEIEAVTECSSDSSSYDAFLILNSLEADLDSSFIEFSMYFSEYPFWGDTLNERIYVGDTIFLENIPNGQPIRQFFRYSKNGDITGCHYIEYPENPCYNILCDVIELGNLYLPSNFQQIEEGAVDILYLESFYCNILLPYADVYFYINDSLYLYRPHRPIPVNALNNIYSGFHDIQFEITDTVSLDIVIELDDCIYTYNLTEYYDIIEPISCDDIEFDIDFNCNSYQGNFTVSVIPINNNEEITYLAEYKLHNQTDYSTLIVTTTDGFYFSPFLEVGADIKVSYYNNGELCTIVEDEFYCLNYPIPNTENCYDYEVETYATCSADSSTFEAYLIVSNFDSELDSSFIELSNENYTYFGDSLAYRLYEGDTLFLNNLPAGSPICQYFWYRKNGQINGCYYCEYPETLCHTSICDELEITNPPEVFINEEEGYLFLLLNGFDTNFAIPNAEVYHYLNDSLMYQHSHRPYGISFFGGHYAGGWGLVELGPFFLDWNTIDYELVIEFEECTYTYNETFYGNQEPIECENFAADISIECINEEEYNITLAVTGFDENEGYLVNGVLHYSEAIVEGPFIIDTGYNYILSPANDLDCTKTFSVSAVSCTALSIELLSFRGEILKKGNYINWSTASETDNDYFTVQYSTDGINFNDIAKINALQNSTIGKNYDYLDSTNKVGKHYYRLLATDANGKTEVVSDVVKLTRERDITFGITIVDNVLYINSDLVIDKQFEITIFDLNGRAVISNKGQSYVNIENLIPSIYFIKVSDGETHAVAKFTKQ